MAQIASLEWQNDNLSRAYPLDLQTGGAPGTLPSQLLVNGCLLYDCSAIGGINNLLVASAYISRVDCTKHGVSLTITCTLSTGVNIIFDRLLFIGFGADKFSLIKFMAETDGLCISGSFTVGDVTCMRNYPTVTELNETNGKLSPGVLHDISGLYVSAIKVGSEYLSGEVELVSGPGITFEVEQTDTGSRLTIENTKYALPEENLVIKSDSELLASAVDIYGTPIRSINDVILPDERGNISLVTVPENTDDDGNDDIIIGTAGVGTVTLRLKKDPCVEDGTIEDLASQAQSLNERCAILNAAQLGLDNAINSLATQLTRIN